MTAENLTLFAGALLSFIFAYVPKIKPWYEALESQYKRLVMALALAIVSGAIVGLACWNIVPVEYKIVTCDQAGIAGVVKAFLLAIIANQSVYWLFVRKSDVS